MKTYLQYISENSFKVGDIKEINYQNELVSFQVDSIDKFNAKIYGMILDKRSGNTNRIILNYNDLK